jgi:hypothetical protein
VAQGKLIDLNHRLHRRHNHAYDLVRVYLQQSDPPPLCSLKHRTPGLTCLKRCIRVAEMSPTMVPSTNTHSMPRTHACTVPPRVTSIAFCQPQSRPRTTGTRWISLEPLAVGATEREGALIKNDLKARLMVGI